VHYSLYHFISLFQNFTGFSPNSFLQQRRLSESVKELINGHKKVLEIAFDYQFGSIEAYSRAIKKQFGLTPAEIKKGYSLTVFPLLNSITEDYIQNSSKIKDFEPQKVELKSKLLAGNSIFVPDTSTGDEISALWQSFFKESVLITSRKIPEKYYQVQFWSDISELGGLYFFVGVEIESIENIPPQFVLKEIPESNYLKFVHKGFSNKVGLTYKYIYNQYLPETEYILDKPFNFEYYGEKYQGPFNPESESEIFIPIQ
jgi:AraC family transcriptional regulator